MIMRISPPSLGRLLVCSAVLAASVMASSHPACAQPATALGDVFDVNSATAGQQQRPKVAGDDDGNFVIAWAGDEEGDVNGILARRYDSAGNPLGADFVVNTYTTGRQQRVALDMHPDGTTFVVTWTGYDDQDGDRSGVYGRAFNGATPIHTGEEQVNIYTEGFQVAAAVVFLEGLGGSPSNLTSGSFDTALGYDNVVVMDGVSGGDPSRGVIGRRTDSSGSGPNEDEFQINTWTTGTHSDSKACAATDGDFVVVWTVNGQDGSDRGMFGQRYDVSADQVGTEFQINAYTTGRQGFGDVCCGADGRFTVVWFDAEDRDGDAESILGRHYDASGVPGDPFVVNAYTTGSQVQLAIDCDASGRSVAVWYDGNNGIVGRRISPQGSLVGQEFEIYRSQVNPPQTPDIALSETGGFVVTWQERGIDGDLEGIQAQRMLLSVETTTTTTTTSTSTTTTTVPLVCSRPVSSGAGPVASDCLFILRVAVGSEVCVPQCLCAPSGSLPVVATDALFCLNIAVGVPGAVANCPCD